MTPLIAGLPVLTPPTEAERLAARNWRANADALARRGDPLPGDDAVAGAPAGVAWAFGRDGYLTCLEPGDRWFAGCSVPLLAAAAMLKPLDGSAGAACLLAPAHAAQIRVVLDRLAPAHAAICVVPDARALGVMLRCDDFSADIARGRLWLAAGADWSDCLARVLRDAPGLPTPTRFIRMPDSDGATIDRLIGEAQRVFADQNARRTAVAIALRDNWAPSTVAGADGPRVCVIARSTFRLWDDAGHALWSALGASPTPSSGTVARFTQFDPDDPAGSSPLELATAAAGSDALVAADLSRADAPRLVPDALPWITWLTTPRVPPFTTVGPNDRLLLADAAWRADALRGGWPAGRVDVAGWPPFVDARDGHDDGRSASRAGGHVAIIADTSPADAPEALAEFSSHGLLWERVRRDVMRDPFAVPADPAGLVRAHAVAEGVPPEALDVALFVGRLVVPAYQHAVADALLAAGIPLRLHGAGWADLPRFAPHAAGAAAARAALLDAARAASALIHAWPAPGPHPVDALGRPVVRVLGSRKDIFLRDVRAALTQSANEPRTHDVPELSAGIVLATLRTERPR